MRSRVTALARKETRELLRDPIYLTLALLVPLVIMGLLGLGLSMDVKNLPLLFYDQDHSALSREYINSFTNSEYFHLLGLARDDAEAARYLQAGEARGIVVIPPDFSRRLHGGEPVAIQVLIDGSFPSRADVVRGYIAAINAQFNERVLQEYLSARGQAVSLVFPVTVEGRVWYNPTLESKNSIVPGLLVLNLLFSSALFASLVVAREKESGTIFNLYCSPVRRVEVIAGKALPYIGVTFINYLMIFIMSLTVFKARFTGSFALLTAGSLLYIACTIGIGLLVSILVRTQVAAMLITFMITIIPAFLYSGFLTPVSSMEATGQLISYVIPATWFIGMVRGIYLKGLGFSYYAWNLVTLTVYAAAVYALAVLFFKKREG